MKLVFSNEYINLLVILVGMIVILDITSRKAAAKRALRFGNFTTLEKVIGRKLIQPDIIPMILRILAVTLMIIGLSDPKLIYEQDVSEAEYVIALDTSSSMTAPDFYPNRIEAAKQVVSSFIEDVHANIGLITFSGEAHVKSSVTSDKEKLLHIVENITIEPPAGTAIGDALIGATTLFTGRNTTRIIILITDGQNNAGTPINETLPAIKRNNITVYTIGMGSNVTINVTLPSSLYGKNATYAIPPTLDEVTLITIANETGGEYNRAENTTSLQEIFKSTIQRKTTTLEPTFYIMMGAVLLLILEWGLEVTKYKIIP